MHQSRAIVIGVPKFTASNIIAQDGVPVSNSQKKNGVPRSSKNMKGNKASDANKFTNKELRSIKKTLKEELLPLGNSYSPKDDTLIRTIINRHAQEINTIKQQLLNIQATQKREAPPLQMVGSLLTGTIADAVHLLVNPGSAPLIGYPGVEEASYFRGNMTPLKSIPLLGGLCRIIATPLGRYALYVSNNVDVVIPGVNYGDPIIQIDFNSSGTIDYLIRCDPPDSNGANAYMTQETVKWSLNVGVEQFVSFAIPEQLIGYNITFGGVTVNITAAGQYLFSSNVVPPVDDAYQAIRTIAVGVHHDFLITGGVNASASRGELVIGVSMSLPSMQTFAAATNTWTAYQIPSLVQVFAGGYANVLATVGMSLLIGSDASAIADGGYLNAWSTTTSAVSPNGIPFNDWVSDQSHWFYKGKLRDGSYQIYLPRNILEMVPYTDQALRTPFTGPYHYNMIATIDNSFVLGGGLPPVSTQAHITVESVFASRGASSIIPSTTVIMDPGFPVALALLRAYYTPCCNPDHFDSMAKWVSNTFNELVNAGKRVISDPVNQKMILNALKTGGSLVLKAAPAVLSLL